jgi:hypothetical protein
LSNKVLANGKIGFGVTAVDYDNVSGNRNGVYKIEAFLNGNLVLAINLIPIPLMKCDI